jgi:hypothetical protein
MPEVRAMISTRKMRSPISDDQNLKVFAIIKRGKYLTGFGSINGNTSHRSWGISAKEAYLTYKSLAESLANEIGGKALRVKL